MASRERFDALGCNSSRGRNKKIDDFYDIGNKLTEESSGRSGEVVRGTRKEDGAKFAVKIISMDEALEDRSQIEALAEVNHPAIIQMVDWFETPSMLYVVMELAMGGELFGRIEHGAFSERDAAAAFRQILEAIGHMHSRGMVHCDLKPENILYQDDSDDSQIKIADFGFAQVAVARLTNLVQFLPGGAEGGERLYKEIGTLSYSAPEVLRGTGYGTKADMWSLGVILYILLSGIHPFGRRRTETDRHVKHNIESGSWRFYQAHFKTVSAPAKDLISRLLTLEPAARFSWDQAIEHEWIKGNAPGEALGGEYLEQLAAFNKKRGLHRLASHALAGLVSRLAAPDAIAALSAQGSSLPRVLQEGSIQPLVSLAYSRDHAERRSALNALANLALQPAYQPKMVAEGALRRLTQLALKPAPSLCSDVKFFAALALARLAANPELRPAMLQPSTSDNAPSPTLPALVQLAQLPPVNPSRAAHKATEALALLALEVKAQSRVVASGALPALLAHAFRPSPSPSPDALRHATRRALLSLFSHALQRPRLQGAATVEALNCKLNGLYFRAVDDAHCQHEEVLGALAGLSEALEEEGVMSEVVAQEGTQAWQHAHRLLGAAAQEPVREEGNEEEEEEEGWAAELSREETREGPEALGLEEGWREHLSEARDLLKDIRACASPDQSLRAKHGWCDSVMEATAERAHGGEEEEQQQEIGDESEGSCAASPRWEGAGGLARQARRAVARLTEDRGKLLEEMLREEGGRKVPDSLRHAFRELTDAILLLSDAFPAPAAVPRCTALTLRQ